MQYLCVEFFFEKWLSKLSYEIKVKIKEVLTCSVVVLRYTVLKWNKILLLSVRCIWNISKNLVSASANSKQVAGRLVLHFVIHCVRTCFKAKNEIIREVVVLYIKVQTDWTILPNKPSCAFSFFPLRLLFLSDLFFQFRKTKYGGSKVFHAFSPKSVERKSEKKSQKKSLSTIYTWEKKGKPP